MENSLFPISYPLVREILLVLALIMSVPIRSGANNISADSGHAEIAMLKSLVLFRLSMDLNKPTPLIKQKVQNNAVQ